AALAIVQTGLLLLIPESPKFLAIKGRYDESRAALQKLRGNLDTTFEYEELIMMLEAGRRNGAVPKPSLWQVLSGKTDTDLRHLVFCVLFLMLSQQWSGAKGVMFYSTEILSTTFHLSSEEVKHIPSIAQLLTLGIGAIGAVAVVIGMSILDRVGRRTVLIVSSLATTICAALIVVGSKLDLGPMVATFMYVFNLVFQSGSGFIPYLSASELLPYYALGSISGLATSINCLTLFIVSFIFPILDKALGSYLFVPFIVTNFITFLFAVFMMPEAKGKLISEVISEYQGPPHIVNRADKGDGAHTEAAKGRASTVGHGDGDSGLSSTSVLYKSGLSNNWRGLDDVGCSDGQVDAVMIATGSNDIALSSNGGLGDVSSIDSGGGEGDSSGNLGDEHCGLKVVLGRGECVNDCE
ncbi:Bifunctional purine biosynthesis protein PurH, partial [Coemansia sp. RSA 2703]